MAVFSRIAQLSAKYPIIRGMLSYATIWPTSSLIQQSFTGRTFDNYDYMQALRFSLYGSLFVAPTLFCWVRFSSRIWPHMNFKTAVTKAAVEQVSYGPAAMACFYFGMTLLEGKTVKECKTAVEQKFIPSYKVALCFWPFLQTINFLYIPERNRVVFVSVCSMIWTCFLAYMHQLNHDPSEEQFVYEQPQLKQ